MSVMDRIKKTSRIKESSILSESTFFKDKEMVPTEVPMINVALTGSLDGGIMPGFTAIAGPSKHFKTAFSLVMASSYLSKYDDAVILFYDTEFGSPEEYFENFDIDTNRVFHSPVTNVEELKFDILAQLEELKREDNVLIIIDSIGNIASKKEIEDAMNEKSVADMSRAKSLKSLFRIITPYLAKKNIPLVGINHTYKEIGLFPKDIMGGGTGAYYAADNIWFVGRRQNKKGTEIQGYDFIIKVEKSRFVKEGSKIPISVSFDSGIEQYSGLLEVALAGGFVQKPKNGWYAKVNLDTGEMLSPNVREKDTLNGEFWEDLLEDERFKTFIENHYKIGLPTQLEEDFLEE